MSGVLDRMVQRSRGQLPAVEPLVAPQKTPLAVLHTPQGEITERPTAARTSAANWPGRSEVPREERMPRQVREAPKSGANPEEHTDSLPAATAHQRQVLRIQEAEPEPLRAPGEITTAGPASVSDGAPKTDGALKTDRGSLEPVARFTDSEVRSEASARNQARTRETSEPARSPQTRRVEQQPKSAVVDDAAIEAKLDSRPREHAERRAEKPAVQASEPAPIVEAGERTEIHITIGSVELRAPRVEEKAPPFRPRVTLEEFLRGRAGAES